MTVSGTSFGPANAPATKIPSRLVASGLNSGESLKPWRLSLTSSISESAFAARGGFNPTDNTAMSKRSVQSSPSSVSY